MTKDQKRLILSGLDVLSKGSLPLAGFVYASGFLVVFTFLESFGLRGASTEFFKAKYIYIGSLCLLFPASILFPFVLLRLLLERPGILRTLWNWVTRQKSLETQAGNESSQGFGVDYAAILLTTNMLLVFYVFVAFAPVGLLRHQQHLIILNFLVPVAGSLVVRSLEKWVVPERRRVFGVVGRSGVLLLFCLPFDIWCFHSFSPTLVEMFWGDKLIPSGGIYFVLLWGWLCWSIHRTNKRRKEISDPVKRTAMIATAACFCFATYYLSVLSFGYRVYPYIPAEKGGGDYTASEPIAITFTPTATNTLPEEVIVKSSRRAGGKASLIVIDETSSEIYLADKYDAGGPSAWRLGNNRPKVFKISKNMITSITYPPIIIEEAHASSINSTNN